MNVAIHASLARWEIAVQLAPLRTREIDPGLVQKNRFCIPEYTTTRGELIPDLKIGWESYGRLNEARDNVVLVPHFFSANSHAAGRYASDDREPGYWDSIIGPGRAIDTDRFFVLSVDSLVNLNTKDGRTISSGPSSLKPGTKRPYGLSFPVVGIPDFVRVQKALLDSLNIASLHAVVGASMGGLQAYEWAAAYPEFVRRVIAVTAAPTQTPYRLLQLELWTSAVRLDPNWRRGAYYGGPEPTDGVAQSFFNILVGVRHPDYAASVYDHGWADATRDPMRSILNEYAIERAFGEVCRWRARHSTDANHLLYMTRANQGFIAGTSGSSVAADLSNLHAPTLVIQSRSDLLFPLEEGVDVVSRLIANGTEAHFVELNSIAGHYGGITDVGLASTDIRSFLECPDGQFRKG